MKRISKIFIMPLLICLSSIIFVQSASAHGSNWRTFRSVYYDDCCNKNIVVYKKCYYWVKKSYCDCNGCPHSYRSKYCYYYPVKRITKYHCGYNYYGNNCCNSCYSYNYNNCCCGYGNGYGYGYRYGNGYRHGYNDCCCNGYGNGYRSYGYGYRYSFFGF